MKTIKLTVAQATNKLLKNQYGNRDGKENNFFAVRINNYILFISPSRFLNAYLRLNNPWTKVYGHKENSKNTKVFHFFQVYNIDLKFPTIRY